MSDLIDREALKDAVKRYAGEPTKEKDRKCQAICLDMLGTIDAQPTASPWHRVEESPKKYGTYIVYWKDGEKFWWEKADWDEDWCTEEPNWYSYRDSRATIIEPDYWMPIEPPKEEEHGN